MPIVISKRAIPTTWSTLGSPWPGIQTAIQNLTVSPQTVNITYSFMLPGVVTDGGASVELKDQVDSSVLHGQFVLEIIDSLTEWKNIFESIYSTNKGFPNNLTITFINLGDETGTSVPSSPSNPNYILPHADNIGDFRFGMHPIDGIGNVAGHGYSPGGIFGSIGNVGGDTHYDSAENWRLDGSVATGASIKLVTVHEIGHNFGIGHNSNPNSIMFPTFSGADNFSTKFQFGLQYSETDRTSIRRIYG